MPQFDLEAFSSQFFWLILTFAILYFLVSKFIAPKAESILTKRNQLLNENIGLARDYKEQAELIELEKQEKLAQINEEVEAMHDRAEKILSQHFSQQKAELAVILENKHRQSEAEIKAYIEKFHAKEKEPSIRLAGFIVKKITGKEADHSVLDQIISREN